MFKIRTDRRQFGLSMVGAMLTSLTGSLFLNRMASAAVAHDEQYRNLEILRKDGMTLDVPSAITVVGIGGHGCWPAFFSALCGVRSMLITDMGTVAPDDMGRTLYRQRDIGRPKTEALADIIREFREDVEIETNTRRLEPGDDDIFHGEVLFNGVDYKPLEEWLAKEVPSRKMKYVHGFYHGNGAGVTTHAMPENTEYIPGSEGPAWTSSAAMSGCMATMAAFVRPIDLWLDPAEIGMSKDNFWAAVPSGPVA